MKLLLAAVTAIAVLTADGRDFSNEPEDQVNTDTEVPLFPDATKGQILGQHSLNGPKQDQQLEDNPRERRLRKTLCRRKLGGRCVRRRKTCPGHLPDQTLNSKPYCSKFHRCCHRVISTTTSAPTTTHPEYKAHQTGKSWLPSQCPQISGDNVHTATTLKVCMMLCTESDECTALNHELDYCELLKCPIPAPEPEGNLSGNTPYSIQQEYKAHQTGKSWLPSQCPQISGDNAHTVTTLKVCMMLCTESDECTALHHEIDYCELLKCPIPAPEPEGNFSSNTPYSIQQE